MTLVVEDERIATHLAGAEHQLRARDVRHLPLPVRRVRDLMIDALAAYRRSGRFPRNHTKRALTPVFIDEHGTRCAMAHLLELVGAQALVQRVHRNNNLARIRDLAGDAELVRWLAAMGLTVDEAARIQPSYCARRSDCYCGQVRTPRGVGEGVVVRRDTGSSFVRIAKVYKGEGFAVGDEIALNNSSAPAGTTVVVGIDGVDELAAIPIPAERVSFTSCNELLAGLPRLTLGEIVDAYGPSCNDKLHAMDVRFDELVCGELPDGGSVVRDTGARDAVATPPDGAGFDAATSAPPTAVLSDDGGCSMTTPSMFNGATVLAIIAAAALTRRLTLK